MRKKKEKKKGSKLSETIISIFVSQILVSRLNNLFIISLKNEIENAIQHEHLTTSFSSTLRSEPLTQVTKIV